MSISMQDLLNVSLQLFALGIPIPAIDLGVLDANVMDTKDYSSAAGGCEPLLVAQGRNDIARC